MKRNLQRLGAALSDRMKSTAGAAVPVTSELGTINKDLSLTVSSVRTAIPKGDYMVDITLSSGNYNTSSDESHSHRLPAAFRTLKAGDRVLVVWCGFEPIVISIITKS